ncbi:MAG: adaptor protein MecA, partial [Bacilli bacterium]|nr:adaptor protein MecA [Bacilli bacterium]
MRLIRDTQRLLRKEHNLKIEKLNENKLKITLDINDLKTRNIDIKSFVSNTPESQDLFWDVMQEAEQKFGFN